MWVCYEASSPNFFWKIFIFSYLGILQIVGIVLAFQTRKVKIPGLKDSKFVAAVVYISSIVLVALALVTFTLRTYINISSGIRVVGIFTMTTMILVLIFIPKVLYQQHLIQSFIPPLPHCTIIMHTLGLVTFPPLVKIRA